MTLNPIGLAIPFFLLFIAVEWFVARRLGRRVYRLNDAIADLSCGMGDRLMGVLMRGAFFGVYVWLWEEHRVLDYAPSSAWDWAIGLVGVDFCYYWFHRFCHRTHIGWATHVVHHHSEEYNLAVALRQSWFGRTYSWIFYLPLAVLGVSPAMYALSSAISLIYQFWIHTRLIGRLGLLEVVLNTPSHHRVHHGINPEYIDKNYAGILIVWDHLFGTFAPERAEVLYGTLAPLRSWDPLVANTKPLLHVLAVARRARGLWMKLATPFMPPSWDPSGGTPSYPPAGRGYDPDLPARLRPYIVAGFVPAAALIAAILLYEESLPAAVLYAGVGFSFLTMFAWAALFEGRPWGPWLEVGRLLLGAALSILWLPAPSWLAAALAYWAIALVWFAWGWRGVASDGDGVVNSSS